MKWGLPCLRRVLLPDPVPQYLESTLLCWRHGARRALSPKCSRHRLWAAACGSVQGSQLQPLQPPASWQGQCCHLHGAISEVAKHCLCSSFCHQLPISHLHLPETGPEQWMCIYSVVCLEVKGGEGDLQACSVLDVGDFPVPFH